eukprot:CAMPEP_0113897120 /NCGR_PEP_ID=MMETSP0780_2-20120614/18471_1 /TAXON_ID=652834 /ORGANISM="Palpitomonas bilix" /LENGTH=331 /DNA_ID=CAMNT_0000888485 /DNA_START=249 /DNA_END=1240 /DNA_ORIENTATION=- /assembly_acc=CAM_ASM_000599
MGIFSVFRTDAKIGIHTDKLVYYGGDLITGHILLQVMSPLDCKSVVLKVTGHEKTEWEEERVRYEGPPEHQREIWFKEQHEGKNEFFKNKVIVSDFNGTIAPGQYAFPFQYQLPQGIPGVFEYHEKYGRLGCKVEAAIRYKLKATLDVGGFFMKDLKAKIHAVVHERKDPSIKPAYGENTSTVRLLGCIPKGKATLKAWFNNVSYTMGEVAYVKADISNDSKRDIGSMNTVLMREIIIRGRGFNNRHTIKGEVLKNKYPGVKALEKSEQDLPLQLNVAQPTANGNLISCRYWLDIECDISFAPDIEVHMPVEIFAPQPEVSGVILEGWEGA